MKFFIVFVSSNGMKKKVFKTVKVYGIHWKTEFASFY